MALFYLLKRRDEDGQDSYDRQPRQNDQHRESTDRPCHHRWPTVVQLMVAHAAFSMQLVKVLTACCLMVSDLTTLSTNMRQPRQSLSPCAAILPTPAAAVIGNSNDHGTGTSLIYFGLPSSSK